MVVPSPTSSSVLIEASFIISRIAAITWSSLSIFLAIVTPSLVINGEKVEWSIKTLLPFGPNVCFTVPHKSDILSNIFSLV